MSTLKVNALQHNARANLDVIIDSNGGVTTNGSFTANGTVTLKGVISGNVIIGLASSPSVNNKLYVQGSAAASVNTLVDGATVTPDFSTNNNFTLTLGGNRAIANPNGPTVGQSGTIYLVQDSTGGRTLTWGNTWRFQGNTAPTLSTSANSVDMLVYAVRTTANISAQLITNIG